MALKPVQDPNLLAALDTPSPTGPKPVTDPALLAQLDGAQTLPRLEDTVPGSPEEAAVMAATPPAQAQPEPSLWERVKTAQTGDPIIDMWLSGLTTAVKGAPETAMNSVGNMGVMATAGLTAPFVSENWDDAAGFTNDFLEQNLMRPQGESAQQLTAALGEAFAPAENIKDTLGEKTLELTGSPDAAATASMAPDFLSTVLGLPRAPIGRTIDTARRTRLDDVNLTGNSRLPGDVPGRFDASKRAGLIDAPAANPNPPTRIDAPEMDPFDLGANFKVQDAFERNMSGARPNLPKVTESILPPIVEDLRAANIKLRPVDVEAMRHLPGKTPGLKRQGLKDQADLHSEFTQHNQRQYTNLAADDLNVKAGAGGLDDAAYAQAAAPAEKIYNLVEDVLGGRELSEPMVKVLKEARDAVNPEMARGEKLSILGLLGKLRKRASRHMQATDELTEAKGYAERNLADALQDELIRELKVAGEPQLAEQMLEARELFGKIYDYHAATRAGQVDPAILYKIDKKSGGRKLTGRAKLIADGYGFAENVSKRGQTTAARAGKETKDGIFAAVKEGAKRTIGKIPGLDVAGDVFQNTLGKPDPTRVANYGRRTEMPGPRTPEQPELDLREILALDTPGQIGARPPRAEIGAQEDFLGGPLELRPPRGRAGREPTTTARSLEYVMIGDEPLAEPAVNFRAETLADILGLSEPMVKKPGRKR